MRHPLDSVPEQERVLHERDPHHQGGSTLSDVILGGQDGLVNVLGVLLGVAAATTDTRIVVVAGLATAFSESVSMAAVAYTSTRAQRDLFQSEQERELRHITQAPTLERAEVRAIYAAKGFEGELLERVVDTITANPDVWVAVMMAEEHRMPAIEEGHEKRAAVVVGLAAFAGSLIPCIPFFVLPVRTGMWGSALVAAIALFAMGFYKGRVTTGRPARSGLEIALIGMVSALVGYAVGVVLRVPG